MFATHRREYENFTHLPDESIDALFQRFTCIVNNTRANVVVLPYTDHDRAIKLLHALDRSVWSAKVEAIEESSVYDTLTEDELFSKLKSSEVDRGLRAKAESTTESHSLALVSGSGGRTNTNSSSRMFSLSSFVSLPDEEFDELGEDELALLTRKFERLHENRMNMRRTTRTCYRCGKQGHFIEPKNEYKHCPRIENKHRSRCEHKHKYKDKDKRRSRKGGYDKKKKS